jgi:hypothetical protein
MVKVVIISDVSLVSGQGGKQVYNQIVDMSPHGVRRCHNMPSIANHGCFLLFIESCGRVPGQGFRVQMEPPESFTIPFIKGWSPHIELQSHTS